MMSRFLLVCFLATVASPAATIYRLHFAADVTSNRSVARRLDGAGVVVDVGSTFRGYVDLDFSLSPPMVVTVDPTDGTSEGVRQSNTLNPEWIVGYLLEFSFTPPSGTLAFPTTFTGDRFAAPPGATDLDTPTLFQRLKSISVRDTLFVTRQSQSHWEDATQRIAHDSLFNMILPGLPFFDATGGQPFPVTPVSLSSGLAGINFVRFGNDSTQGVSGRLEEYHLSILFSVTSASGEFLTPEPASWACVLAGLGLLAWRRPPITKVQNIPAPAIMKQ